MQRVNIQLYINSGSNLLLLHDQTITVAGIFSYYIPKDSFGQVFEVYASTPDSQLGEMTVFIQ